MTPYYASLNRDATVFELEHRIVRPDGSVRIIYNRAQPHFDNQGKLLNYTGCTLDITERHQAAQLLLESEEEFKNLFNNAPVGFHEVDAEGRLVRINQTELTMLGYSAEELTGQYIWKLGADEEQVRRFTLAKLNGEPALPEGFERRYRRKDGSTLPVWATDRILKREDGSIKGIRTTIQDITERKRAEAAVRLFRVLMNQSSDGVEVIDPETGRLLDVNETTCQESGYTREELLSMRVADLDNMAVDFSNWGKHVEQIRQAGFKIFEGQHKRKDGSIFPVEVSVRYVKLERDYMIATVRDITERKRAEELLLASEQRLNAFFTSAPAGLVLLDKELRYLQLNETVAKINGVPMKDHLGKTIREVLPKLAPAAEPLLQKVLATGEPLLNIELSGETPGQRGVTRHWLESFFPIMGKDGKPDLVGVIFVEITAQKRTEESRSRLAMAVEQAAETIVITDIDAKILYANPAFEKTTGYTRAEALGQNPRILKSGKHDAGFYRLMWGVLKRGVVWHGHFINKRKDGTLFEEEATISPVRDDAGKVINYVAVKRDVSREIQLESQFLQSQKMETIGHLAGGVAHDFNNILGAMFMQVEMLKMDKQLPAAVQDGLTNLRLDADRAANLVRQLLLFARRSVMQMSDLNLNDVVTNFSKMLRRIIGEDVSLLLQLNPKALTFHADPGMIEQVLMNLAVNSRDAMPKGGKLIVETTAATLDEASVQRLDAEAGPGDYVCLSVSDTGTGIPPEALPKIFEPFFTTKDIGKGSGLGLASVFGIVKQHKGCIEVDNRPDKGVTFKVYFPALASPVIKTGSAAVQPPRLRGKETILWVEDEQTLRHLTSRALEQYGYRVLEAANGPEALEIWKKLPKSVNLLLTDLMLPEGLSGLELAKRLKSEKPDLKVIYVSGYSLDAIQGGLELKAGQNFIQKPISPEPLLRTLRQTLDA